MATLQAEKKGKLELLLDDFTQVHGTVLLGMHKELQTLRDEVDARVETRINAVLDLIKSADSNLCIHVKEAEQILSKLDGKEKRATAAIDAAKKEATTDISSARERITAEASEIIQEFTKHKDDLLIIESSHLQALETKQQAILSKISSSQLELQGVIAQSEHQCSEFQQAIAHAMDHLVQEQQEHQSKMTTALKFADKLNADSLTSLKAVNERSEEIHLREIALQQRTRQATIAVGLAILTTLGVWIWLTLPH